MLRVTMQIKDNGIGQVKYDIAGERNERGLTEPSGYPNEGNHIAIFECPLKSLPLLSIHTTSHKDLIFEGRLNFAHWKLIDFDNYM